MVMRAIPPPVAPTIIESVRASLLARNEPAHEFFAREARRLAEASRRMADRFAQGGRLWALGRGQGVTDAQHVAVEFAHPLIVGKRALPAVDLSWADAAAVRAIVRPDDIVMGFAPPEGDDGIARALAAAGGVGALTFALSGPNADYAFVPPSLDPYIHQEIIEMLYHVLWETVHVFLEHRGAGHDLGSTGFLYPHLEDAAPDVDAVIADVSAGIVAKARTDEELRLDVADRLSGTIANAAATIARHVRRGATLLLIGNGGSATDATDFAFDCAMPPGGGLRIPALSLAWDPACLTAVANDIGREAIFVRPLIAHARRSDVLVAISTSGGSANVIAALEHARAQELLTVAILGYDGGEIVRRQLAHIPIVVDCDYIPRVQEVHASIYHTLIEATRVELAVR